MAGGVGDGVTAKPCSVEVAVEQVAQAQVVVDDQDPFAGFVHGRQS